MSMINVSAIRRRKIWRTNAMKRKHLLGRSFVLRQKVRMRPRTSVWNSQQIHVRGDVHLLGIVAGIGFCQIEDEVGTAFSQAIKRLWPPIEHVIERLMTELRQSVGNFLTVLFYFSLAPRVSGIGLDSFFFCPDVVQHSDFQFVAHSTSSVIHYA